MNPERADPVLDLFDRIRAEHRAAADGLLPRLAEEDRARARAVGQCEVPGEPRADSRDDSSVVEDDPPPGRGWLRSSW